VLANTETKPSASLSHTNTKKEQRSSFVSKLLPAYTKVPTHSVISPVHWITQVSLHPIKQKPILLAYFSNGKRSADMKVNASLVILQHVTLFPFYWCFERTCIAVRIVSNQQWHILSSVCGLCFTIRQSLFCSMLSSEYFSICVRGKTGGRNSRYWWCMMN
jgi:hypothetical protein